MTKKQRAATECIFNDGAQCNSNTIFISSDKEENILSIRQIQGRYLGLQDEIKNGTGMYYPAVENYVKGVETKRK